MYHRCLYVYNLSNIKKKIWNAISGRNDELGNGPSIRRINYVTRLLTWLIKIKDRGINK